MLSDIIGPCEPAQDGLSFTAHMTEYKFINTLFDSCNLLIEIYRGSKGQNTL